MTQNEIIDYVLDHTESYKVNTDSIFLVKQDEKEIKVQYDYVDELGFLETTTITIPYA